MKKFNIRIQLYTKHDVKAVKTAINEVLQANGLTGTWERFCPALLFRGVDPVTILPVLEAVLNLNCGLTCQIYEKD